METRARFVMLAAAMLVIGCGGGGGNSQQSSNTTLPPTNQTPAEPSTSLVTPVLKGTSYLNAKAQGLAPVKLPASVRYDVAGAPTIAYARANFKGNGKFALFTAKLTYDATKPVGSATPSEFMFWNQQSDGTWVADTAMIDTTVGCLHPRKALVVDFNSDNKPDVLVACHGYDNTPFPGEQMFLVESQANGVYKSHAFGPVGFFHGASAADLNGDGKVDIIAVDMKSAEKVRVFTNSGTTSGVTTFNELSNVMPASVSNYGFFSVELIDVNGDDKLDIIAGGHESGGADTVVIAGDGSANFSLGNVTILPKVNGNGAVLDFVVDNGKLYVNRTDDRAGSFYSTKAIQTVELSTNNTVNVESKTGQWFPWLLPTSSGVVSDNVDLPM